MLPRQALLTVYKSFARPHLDYGDELYDQPNNTIFTDQKGVFKTILLSQ